MDKRNEIKCLKITGLFTALFCWSCVFVGIPSAVICSAVIERTSVAMLITGIAVLGTSIYFTARPGQLAKFLPSCK